MTTEWGSFTYRRPIFLLTENNKRFANMTAIKLRISVHGKAAHGEKKSLTG